MTRERMRFRSRKGEEKNFSKAGVQQLPKGFSTKRKRRQVKVRVGNDDQIAGNHAEVSHDIAEQVLIAEIGGGPRWKQVNFPVSIFQDFFWSATRQQ